MTLRPVKTFQILHLSMLFLIPLLFIIFRMVSEPYDSSRVLIENLILIGGGILSSYTLVFFVITGSSGDALPGLIKIYRNSLTRISFLIISNIILALIFVLLIYQLAFFRQIEFLTQTDIEVYLNDATGQIERIGFVRARTPAYLRLSFGKHKLAVKDMASQQWVESQFIKVPNMLSERGMISIWINPRRQNYEELD